MTKEEILVVAAAVVLFVLINIIMWSVIAAKNRRERQKELARIETESVRSVSSSVPPDAPPVRFNIVESIIMVNTDEVID